MTNLIAFVSKFEGIIGALMGVVATLITTQLIKNLGRVEFYFNEYQDKLWRFDRGGIEILDKSDAIKADYYDYKFKIELYNSSESIRILRDLKIGFQLEEKIIYGKLNNSDKTIHDEFRNTTHELNVINIPPKQIVELNIEGSIKKEDLTDDLNIKEALFFAKDHKNKVYKKLIKKF